MRPPARRDRARRLEASTARREDALAGRSVDVPTYGPRGHMADPDHQRAARVGAPRTIAFRNVVGRRAREAPRVASPTIARVVRRVSTARDGVAPRAGVAEVPCFTGRTRDK
jgi:hypothetical protein